MTILPTRLIRSLALSSLVWLSACGYRGADVYHSFQNVPLDGWQSTDTLVFGVDTTYIDSLRAYDVLLDVVHNADYRYRTLSLAVRHNISADTLGQTDTLDLSLVDASGHWLGSGFGTYYQRDTQFISQIFFHKVAGREVRIVPLMGSESLVGIEKIGIRIRRSP